jgi:predicted DCC family thiol-disulfide oxidoreductase YuxK
MNDMAMDNDASPAQMAVSGISGVPDLSEQLRDRMKDRLLVIYDGQCGFCNRSIRWLLRRDRNDHLRFAPSSDPAIQALLAAHGVPPFVSDPGPGPGPDTILVFRNVGTHVEDMLVRSNAILACLRRLPQPWPLLAGCARLIPRPVRESTYRAIARRRYRIWGRYASCPIPTPEERRHFL